MNNKRMKGGHLLEAEKRLLQTREVELCSVIPNGAFRRLPEKRILISQVPCGILSKAGESTDPHTRV
jgi:hypothetical protein